MKSADILNALLSGYRLWGLASMGFFVLFICLLTVLVSIPEATLPMFLALLFSGFLWLGTTALCRHSLVLLKRYIGKELGLVEFLSTQLVVLLFPFVYRKVKKEADLFRREISSEGEETV